MKKLLVVCFALLTLLTGCKKDEINKPTATNSVILRYAESEKSGSYQASVSEYFANLVKEKSDGRITIKVYYDGELGTEEQVLTQLQFGGIALGRVNLLSISEQIPSFSSIFSPLINTSFTIIQNYIENNNNFNFAFQNEKLLPLTILAPGLRCIYSDEVLEINDDNLKVQNTSDYSIYSNIKIGIDNSSMYEKFLSNIGVNPIILGNIATFPSLRNGFIDARESSVSSFITSDEYPYIKEVAILDNIVLPSFILISSEVLNQLNRDDVNLLMDCAQSTMEFGKNYIALNEIKSINKIKSEKIMRRL